MNKKKVRGLKWNLKKLRESVLHFTLKSEYKIKKFNCSNTLNQESSRDFCLLLPHKV